MRQSATPACIAQILLPASQSQVMCLPSHILKKAHTALETFRQMEGDWQLSFPYNKGKGELQNTGHYEPAMPCEVPWSSRC